MKGCSVFAMFLLLCGLAVAQDSTSATSQQAAPEATQEQPKKNEKKPSKLKKILKRAAPNCANVGGTGTCWSESEREKEAKEKEQQEREQNSQQTSQQVPKSQPAPRSSEATPAGESSSRDSQIDLSPPPGDDVNHEGAAINDVGEFHAWDPHKAAKDIEVGDFYFRDKNYRAAESRYSEALQWKPNDAEATFKLAQAQERLGKNDDAVKNYEAYLKILPSGEFASEAKKAVQRLQSGGLKAKQ